MKKIEKFFRGSAALIFIGLSAQIASGQSLLTNGDFSSGLDDWQTEGLVLASNGVGTLSEGAVAPVLYQPVSVSGYVYELRFDVDLGGLSASAGSGQLDRARLLLYLGTDAANLTPDGAADEAVLIEADSSGLLSVAENAQVVANAALGAGWYSAVVEVISDFEAIAPACRLIDGNGSADSSMGIDNVVLRALDRGRFANISNRGGVGTGANVMIPGFVIEGPTNKSLVIRGSGPTLGELGVPGTITDPQLKLYYKPPGQPPPPAELKAENDNWEEAADLDALQAAMALVGAFAFTEGNLDAAFLVEDLVPGAYTVEVSGVGGVTGVALAEVYDLGASADGPTELVNISNRGFVGTGSSVQIPGFVIRGNRGRVVLVRAVGPTLGDFGVVGTIGDPYLNLYDLTDPSTPLFSNDNWEEAVNTTEVEATAARVGAFPLGAGSKDASILASLPPGNYTAVAKGVDGATGVALVEVYVVTDNQRPTAYGNSLVVTTDVANVLPMDEILGDDTDPENDVLSVSFFTQPDAGTVTMNEDGELVYTSPAGFFGETVFSYRASDGEYESVPATIALEVRMAGTLVWQGGSSGNFNDPANWVGGVAPGVDDPVWIAPEGGGTVVFNADTEVGSIWAGDSDSAVTLELNGKTLAVAGGLKVQPGSTFELMGNGTLDTTQDAVIAGELIWTSGTMTGDAATVIAEGASASLYNNTAYLRGGRDLINKGTLTQTGAGSIISDTAGATSTITNASGATWEANLDANKSIAMPNLSTARLDFVNDGTLVKKGTGSNNLGYNTGAFDFTNNGTLNIDAGTLRMETDGAMNLGGQVKQESGTALGFYRGTGTISGTLEMGSGSVLVTDYSADLTVASGAEITGEGRLYLDSGTVTLSDPSTLPSVELKGATLVANGPLSVGALTMTSGTLSVSGDLTVTGTVEWDGVTTMSGEGTTIIAAGATATVGTRFYLAGGRNLTNHGTLTQLGQGSIIVVNSGATSTITNAAGAQWTIDMEANKAFAYADNNSTSLDFINEGTLTKSGTGAVTLGGQYGAVNLISSGSLEVESGALRVEARGTSDLSGPITQADGTTLGFYRGTATISDTLEMGSGSVLVTTADLTVASGAEITGEGRLYLDSGTVTLSDPSTLPSVELKGATLVANGPLSVGALTVTSGTLSVSGDLTVTGTVEWDGVTTMSGEGTTIIAAGATATVGTRFYLAGGRNLTNHGTLTQLGQGWIIVATPGATSTITNAAGAQWTVDMVDNVTIIDVDNNYATVNFVNEGTLTKKGTGTNNLGGAPGTLNLTSSGVLEINAGTLRIDGASAVLEPAGMLRLTTNGTTRPIIRPGALSIDGALEVILAEGYAPANGTTIRLIDFTSKSGEFNAITQPQGRTVVESYESDGLDVTIN